MKGDTEIISEKVKAFESNSNESLIADYNKQSKCGITGVRGQALYLMAMGHVFFKRFGESPIYMEENVLGMRGQIKLSGESFEYIDKKKLITNPLKLNQNETFPSHENNLNIQLNSAADQISQVDKSNLLPILIEGTETTPKIRFDASNGIFEINGRSAIHMKSTPSVEEFYNPLLDWLDQYSGNPSEQTIVKVQMEYINTCSNLDLLFIFKKFELLRKQNNQVIIFWHYEEGDEDMLETGQDYESIIRVPFKMVPYKRNKME